MFSTSSLISARVISSPAFPSVKVSAASLSPARFTIREQFSSLKYWSPLLLCIMNGRSFFPRVLSALCLISKARFDISILSLRVSMNLVLSFPDS